MKSFEYIDNKKIKLNIYGNGDLKSEVIKSQENDSRIQYCGVVNNEKMYRLLSLVTHRAKQKENLEKEKQNETA